MSLENLTKEERGIVYQCLRASVEGPFFPEWEFHTIFGIWRREAKSVLESWPNVTEEDMVVSLAINNAMNNLLGCPHKQENVWTARAALAAVRKVLTGDAPPGFQTPALAYGADFVMECEGVTREDLD